MAKRYNRGADTVKHGANLGRISPAPDRRLQWPPMRGSWRGYWTRWRPTTRESRSRTSRRISEIEEWSASPPTRVLSARRPRVIEAIRREAPRAHLYPDGGSTEAAGRARRALGGAARLAAGGQWGGRVARAHRPGRLRSGRRGHHPSSGLRAVRDGGDPLRRHRRVEPARRLRDGPRGHRAAGDAADEGRHRLHAAQPRLDPRASIEARAIDRRARQRSAPRDPGRGVPRLLADDPETADGVDLVRRHHHRDLASECLEDRSARRPSRRVCDRTY